MKKASLFLLLLFVLVSCKNTAVKNEYFQEEIIGIWQLEGWSDNEEQFYTYEYREDGTLLATIFYGPDNSANDIIPLNYEFIDENLIKFSGLDSEDSFGEISFLTSDKLKLKSQNGKILFWNRVKE